MSKVILKNINKSFQNKVVLEDISLVVEEGDFVSILGPSGCGKSTLLNIIAGIIVCDSGEIFFDGNDVRNIPSKDRNAIIVFQDYALFPHMTVFDNIGYGMKIRKYNKEDISSKVLEILKIIDLLDKINSYPHELSGGQKQRVAIARALILQPKVLLLDEPFSGLDNNIKKSMKDFVMFITKKFNTTTLMVTHDKEEAFSMSNKVAIIAEKVIEQYDIPIYIYEKPINCNVARFLGYYNIFEGIASKGIFKWCFDDLKCDLTLEGRAYVVLNYREIKIDNKGHLGEIISKQYLGGYTKYIVKSKELNFIIELLDNGLEVGHMVNFTFENYIILL
ncbi:MAG: ABC transporter ATP-binding protein [Lachnospirales bacterium]